MKIGGCVKLDPRTDDIPAKKTDEDKSTTPKTKESEEGKNARIRAEKATHIAQHIEAYLVETIRMIREKIDHMPKNSRFVLLVPAELFFNVTLYNFLLTFAVDRKKYIKNNQQKPNVSPHFAEQLHEMKVHTDFMRIFLPLYIHPTYAETTSVVQKHSNAFFCNHKAIFDSVPRGQFLITCMQRSETHQSVQHQMRLDNTGYNAFSQTGLIRGTPSMVLPTMQDILLLVQVARTHIIQYLQDCTRPCMNSNMNVIQHPTPRAIQGEISIRDILHEIVWIITKKLCGRLQTQLQRHAEITFSILQVNPLQCTHAEFLIFILDSIEYRIR